MIPKVTPIFDDGKLSRLEESPPQNPMKSFAIMTNILLRFDFGEKSADRKMSHLRYRQKPRAPTARHVGIYFRRKVLKGATFYKAQHFSVCKMGVKSQKTCILRGDRQKPFSSTENYSASKSHRHKTPCLSGV